MLLTRIITKGRDDRGSGLVAVIALAAVTAVIGVTVGAVTVSSLQLTNGVAGSVEARAAAQTGIADVEALLRDDAASAPGCPVGATLTSTGSPAYDVEIYADDLANGWTLTPTCPTLDSTRVKLVSTGFADRATQGAGAQGGSVTLEAIFQYVPVPTEIEVIDPAVYAYQIEGDLRNFTLGIEPNTVIASDIQIRRGNFICTNGASVAGSVILAEGHAELSSCSVTGNIHVSEYVQINGKRSGFPVSVSGNVIAAGQVKDSSNRAAYLTSEAIVGGDVWAGGNTELRASPGGTRVSGNLTAVGNNTTRVTVANNTRVNGNVLTTGTYDGRAQDVGGTRSTGLASLAAPPAPQVPNWVDLPFTTATIPTSTWWDRGFRNIVTWSGSCVLGGNSNAQWAALSSYTERTLIDATACTTPVTLESSLGPDVSLRTDIAIISNAFDFNKLPAQASNTTDPRRLYFVVPDNNDNDVPSCENGAGDIRYNNEANINAPLALFFYTPCKVLSDRNFMRGQIYGGTVEFRQQAQWTFVPSTPPGVDFTAGIITEPVVTSAYLGNRLSLRELTTRG